MKINVSTKSMRGYDGTYDYEGCNGTYGYKR